MSSSQFAEDWSHLLYQFSKQEYKPTSWSTCKTWAPDYEKITYEFIPTKYPQLLKSGRSRTTSTAYRNRTGGNTS